MNEIGSDSSDSTDFYVWRSITYRFTEHVCLGHGAGRLEHSILPCNRRRPTSSHNPEATGPQVRELFIPPIKLDDGKSDPGAPAIGVPVAPFPRWMRCPLCDTLATIDSGVCPFEGKTSGVPDRTEYRHEGCTKAKGNISPSALSVRFLLACREGPFDPIFLGSISSQRNVPCKPAQLTLRGIWHFRRCLGHHLQCLACNTTRRMSDAFDQDAQFKCPGHHPHLRRVDHKPCEEVAKSILLGASNSWFSVFNIRSFHTLATDRPRPR